MADAAWKKHNEKIKAKRTKTTKKDPAKNHRQGDRLTVQRLSAEVAGKAQKYTRIGPREFVMMVNKIDRPNTTPKVRDICTFAVYFSVFRAFCRFILIYEGYFVLCYKEKTRAARSCYGKF